MLPKRASKSINVLGELLQCIVESGLNGSVRNSAKTKNTKAKMKTKIQKVEPQILFVYLEPSVYLFKLIFVVSL